MTDYMAQEHALHYLRTKEGKEVDFALVCKDEVKSMIEVKLTDASPSRQLIYFKEKYNYSAIQLVKALRNEYERNGISVLSAEKFLSNLFL